MHIKNAAEIQPIETAHGEIVHEYLGRAAGGASGHSLARILLPPGKAALKHYHPATEESYYILSGQAHMVINGEECQLKAGDAVAIPINAIHQIFNQSDEMLVFLAVCAPHWTPECSVFVD